MESQGIEDAMESQGIEDAMESLGILLVVWGNSTYYQIVQLLLWYYFRPEACWDIRVSKKPVINVTYITTNSQHELSIFAIEKGFI